MNQKIMSKTEVTDLLKKILQAVAPEINFADLDLLRTLKSQVDIDSYDFYQILLKLEQQTGVSVPDPVVRELKNLNELILYVVKKSEDQALFANQGTTTH
jgi:acyl carrier protein